jgi:tRNA threonylcarbamoyladenosine biosynthesis protein TsaE
MPVRRQTASGSVRETIPRMTRRLSLATASPSATMELGRKIGGLLGQGSVIALIGELGCGKTCFTKGLCAGLGIRGKQVTSPTFTLVNEYAGRLPVLHLDLYRIEDVRTALEAGLLDYLTRAERGVAIIEWADRVLPLLPESYLQVGLTIISARKRQITLTGIGAGYSRLLDKVVPK